MLKKEHNPNTLFDYFQYLRIKILAFILALFIQCHFSFDINKKTALYSFQQKCTDLIGP